ncbi:unnamed protein product [Allacma fusca]|uniref:SNTX MACPF/CDC-like domain-containing protein n=1 Tax=Allacma fusca TaxID=39272 RepID=A0A8J2L7I7_9HEXA|nr:unnamed protein product [Allacma fusca]
MESACNRWDARRLLLSKRLQTIIEAEENRQEIETMQTVTTLQSELQKLNKKKTNRRNRRRKPSEDLEFQIRLKKQELDLMKGVKGDFPPNFTEFVSNPVTNFHFQRVRSFSDKLDSFNLDISSQASLLFGNIEAGGMYSYLTESTYETDCSYATLNYGTRITTELLALSRSSVLDKINTNIGRIVGATHYIIGVEWGTDALFSIKWKSSNKSVTESSKASVNMALSSPKFSVEMDSSYQSLKKALSKTEQLEVSVYGNLAMGKLSLKSFEDIEDYMSNVPELTKSINGGKGSPMKYIAISLDKLDKLKKMGQHLSKENTGIGIEDFSSSEDVTLYALHNKMKNEYQDQQDILRKMCEYHSKVILFEEIFPTGYSDILKSKIDRFGQACGIFTLEMSHLLRLSRRTTKDVLIRFDTIKKMYLEDGNGPSIFTEINEDIEKYTAKIDNFLWLSKFGVYFLKKKEALEAIRIENQVKSDVHVFATTTHSKELQESIWYDRLEEFVHTVGYKVFVDCDVREIYNSSCKGFIRRLNEGAVLHKYNKYAY